MFYVDLYKDNDLIVHAPFKDKNKAIEYFNKRCDYKSGNIFLDYDHIEILNENLCLFDCEV